MAPYLDKKVLGVPLPPALVPPENAGVPSPEEELPHVDPSSVAVVTSPALITWDALVTRRLAGGAAVVCVA